MAMRTGMMVLAIATLAPSMPLAAHGPRGIRGGGFFAAGPRGHPMSAWMGSHHPRLR